MHIHLKHPDEPKAEHSEGKISGYGGYSARHEYEQSRIRKNPVLAVLQGLLLAVLLLFSALGVFSLIRGDFVPTISGGDSTGTIKVPTQAELSDSPQDMDAVLSEVERSLITIEVRDAEGGVNYGSGFLVSDDGYAVCSSFLVMGENLDIVAYTADGVTATAELKGMDESLGIALIRLPHEYQYTPISAENSFFVERGKKLYAVAAHKPKVFYGTVAEGIVGSVGPAVKVGKEDVYANVIYLDIEMNKTLSGTAVVDENGATVGFMTGALPMLHGTLSPMIPINVVYTVINDFLVQG